jgi:hypothetical protein
VFTDKTRNKCGGEPHQTLKKSDPENSEAINVKTMHDEAGLDEPQAQAAWPHGQAGRPPIFTT